MTDIVNCYTGTPIRSTMDNTSTVLYVNGLKHLYNIAASDLSCWEKYLVVYLSKFFSGFDGQRCRAHKSTLVHANSNKKIRVNVECWPRWKFYQNFKGIQKVMSDHFQKI